MKFEIQRIGGDGGEGVEVSCPFTDKGLCRNNCGLFDHHNQQCSIVTLARAVGK